MVGGHWAKPGQRKGSLGGGGRGHGERPRALAGVHSGWGVEGEELGSAEDHAWASARVPAGMWHQLWGKAWRRPAYTSG